METQGRLGEVLPSHHQRDAEKWLRAKLRRSDLRADQGLWRIWFSREPCGKFRLARLYEQLVEMSRARGISRRPAQQSADGFLLAIATRAGCAAAWRHGVA